MPLSMVKAGESNTIKRIGGKESWIRDRKRNHCDL